MNKRGITPLIASVLLILLVASLSIFLMTFYEDLIGKNTDQTTNQAIINDYCLHGIDLDISNICGDTTLNLIDLKIKNTKKGDINTFDFIVTETSSDFSTHSDLNLNGLSSRTYSINFDGAINEVEDIIIIPHINVDNISGSCPNVKVQIDSLYICS